MLGAAFLVMTTMILFVITTTSSCLQKMHAEEAYHNAQLLREGAPSCRMKLGSSFCWFWHLFYALGFRTTLQELRVFEPLAHRTFADGSTRFEVSSRATPSLSTRTSKKQMQPSRQLSCSAHTAGFCPELSPSRQASQQGKEISSC